MKAAVYRTYGPAEVVTIENIERPVIEDDEVLVEVHATSITTADWRMRASAFPPIFWLPGRLMLGLRAPKSPVLGREFAGVVVATGKAVTRFRTGERVFGITGNGAHREFLAIREDAPVARLPDGLSFNDGAAVPFGALSALVFLRDFGRLQPGQSVLVLGATGGVGAYALQIAKHMGARVTALASGAKADIAASLGADRVIDYDSANALMSAGPHDLILDTAGITTFCEARRALAPNGVFVPLEFGLGGMLTALVTSLFKGRRTRIGISSETQADMETIAADLATGQMRPVIDSLYPLDRIVDAHRRVETRHKTGSVIVTMPAAEKAAAPAAGG